MNSSGESVHICLMNLNTATLKLRSIQASTKSGKEVATRKRRSSHENQTPKRLAMISAAGRPPEERQPRKASKEPSQSEKTTSSQTKTSSGKDEETKN